jgi:transcriptional regulator of acetoin/glycerol metabolism
VAIAQDRTIDLTDLPDAVVAAADESAGASEGGVAAARDRAERAEIVAAFARRGGDMAKVAADLKVSRTTLWRLMRKHGIHEPGES